MGTPPILVGIDISLGTARALEWAVGEAQRRSCALRLVHVPDSADAALDSGLSPDEVATTVVGVFAVMAARLRPGVPVETAVLAGNPAEALTAESKDAQLLVVGANGVAGYAASALGSVAHRVAVHADCPVVVVSSHALVGSPHVVVVGVDEPAAASRPAVAFARDVCARTGAQLLRVDVSDHAVAPAQLVAASRTADLVVLATQHADERFSTRLGAVPAGVLPFIERPVVLVSGDVDQPS
jgi:nucleotide-binding universal stress UspA family protein